MQQEIYASCVALDEETAVLLIGVSGSGKSDLALRLIESGAKLVADDRVVLRVEEDGVLRASAPAKGLGLLEARSAGIFRLDAARLAQQVPVVLAVQLDDFSPPRLGEALEALWCGVAVPLWRLSAFEASCVAKIRLIVDSMREGSGVERLTV